MKLGRLKVLNVDCSGEPVYKWACFACTANNVSVQSLGLLKVVWKANTKGPYSTPRCATVNGTYCSPHIRVEDGTNLSGFTSAIWKKTWRRPMKLGISFHRIYGDQVGLG